MESNYFKSGRDTGPRSTKSRLTKQAQSKSERDSAPMSRRDRIRRKRALARDRSDQSSDGISNHSQNLKTFSKMMKEERLVDGINKLNRIDEAENEEDFDQNDQY
jgi:hypothetical protein